ncbi:CatB-related O-acetyltransferase [Halorussus sp. AFM4]|uniref:CatB-related O-acetyltransferase n=1 Tax=Halorussus sp. AFM4 TaxID=3421651 RepID=UPI003EBB28B3
MVSANDAKSVLKKVVSLSGYSSPVQELINKAPISTTIQTGAGVEINLGCELSGNIRLADHVHVGSHSILNGDIEVGKRSNLNGHNELHGDIDIGRYCAIAPRVMFRQHDHMMFKPSLQGALYRDVLDDHLESVAKGPIEVGNDVWLGSRSTVLSGVTIGDGAVVGAGAIVTDDVEPYSIVAGVPATHRKWRFDESIRRELAELEWWNWSEEEIQANKEFFQCDLRDADSVYDEVKSIENP